MPRLLVLGLAVAIAVILAGSLVALRQPRGITVSVNIPPLQLTATGEVAAEWVRRGVGFGEAPIPRGAGGPGTPATGQVSFGRGYGGLFGGEAPFARLAVRPGSVVWACLSPDPDGPPSCLAGARFRTQAETVIRPGRHDCFFACNASSGCVPVVAEAPGEFGNVPWSHELGTDAKAGDGLGVFVTPCGKISGGMGPPTEHARAQAREEMSWSGMVLRQPYVEVEVVKEVVEVWPPSSYPPTSARARIEVSKGQVPRSELDDAAKSALARQAGRDYEMEEATYRLATTPDGDRFSVRYTATATALPVPSRFARRIAKEIAGRTVSDAKRHLQERYGQTGGPVDIRDGVQILPEPDGLRIHVYSSAHQVPPQVSTQFQKDR